MVEAGESTVTVSTPTTYSPGTYWLPSVTASYPFKTFLHWKLFSGYDDATITLTRKVVMQGSM